MKTLVRARYLVWIWALASGVASLFITLGQKGVDLMDALTQPNFWIATTVGLLVSSIASPLLTAKWNRWYWSALLAIPVGLVVVFCFFFIRPHSWQPSRFDAWKSVAMFVDIYPLIIIPASLFAGIIGSLVICDNEDSIQPEE